MGVEEERSISANSYHIPERLTSEVCFKTLISPTINPRRPDVLEVVRPLTSRVIAYSVSGEISPKEVGRIEDYVFESTALSRVTARWMSDPFARSQKILRKSGSSIYYIIYIKL